MDSDKYALYVKIDCWQIRRQQYVETHKWCEVCGIVPKTQDEFHDAIILDVHHLSYEHLGNELDEELVSLCRLCHSAFHDPERANYRKLMLDTLRAANTLLSLPKRSLMIEILSSE